MATTFIIDTSVSTSLKGITSKPILVNETDTDYILLNGNDDQDTCGRINAVVLDHDTRKILAVGPTKPYTMEKFVATYGDTIDKTIEITDMIEGLFFQLFWDDRIQRWEIGTHTSVFGNYSYYRMPHIQSPTYRTMICQAMGNVEDLNDWKGLEYMDKKCCFHFVLQHPLNHFVFKIKAPTIFFIGAFELHTNGVTNQIRYIPPNEYENIFPTDMVMLPNVLHMAKKKYDEDATMEDVLEKFVSIQEPNNRMGIVIKQVQTGDVTIVYNPAYVELQKVRGTHPNILYHYLCLKKIKKTGVFLGLFPQYGEVFSTFHELYESLITKVHQSYVDHYVLKTRESIHKKYFYHIQQLHKNVYIPSLSDDKKVIVKKTVVRKYIDGLEVGNVLHILQYELYFIAAQQQQQQPPQQQQQTR